MKFSNFIQYCPASLLLSFCFFFCFVALGRGQKCEDGVDNVINVQDGSDNDDASVKFRDVRVATYDANLVPFCVKGKAALYLPGFLRIISGTLEVLKPVNLANGDVLLDLTVEMDSFFIGRVCDNGKSQNVFVPESACSLNFCEAVTMESCQLLEQADHIEIPKFHPSYIPLEPALFGQVEGEWTLELKLTQNGVQLASLKLEKSWYTVTVGNEADEKAFNERVEKLGLAEEIDRRHARDEL